MAESIEQQVAKTGRRQRFIDEALAAEREALDTGLGFNADEVHAAMEARARGGRTQRLKARRWRE